MALVSFAKINQVMASQVTPIGSSPAAGGTTDSARPNLFDPFWGYFVFGQTLECNYNDANVYLDVGKFTIQGVFTPNAVGVDPAASDQAAFNAMVAKYTALETAFEAMTKAAAPDNYAQWGTANDPRCIALPVPLVDKDSHKVYALPLSLQLEKGTFGAEIRYVATLREAKMPLAKAVINGFVVDNCVLTITLPSPQFARHQIAGTSGEVLQLKHYQSMEVDISANLPLLVVSQAISDQAKALTESLTFGTMTLETTLLTGTGFTTVTVFDGLDIIDDPSVDFDYNAQVMSIAVKARE